MRKEETTPHQKPGRKAKSRIPRFRTVEEEAEFRDTHCHREGVAILGTGINPGFAMDALPIFLTSVAQEVRAIRVKRVNDAGKRRLPLQQKVGAGRTAEDFQRLVDAGSVRHVGLRRHPRQCRQAPRQHAPGLWTMKDLPPAHFWPG